MINLKRLPAKNSLQSKFPTQLSGARNKNLSDENLKAFFPLLISTAERQHRESRAEEKFFHYQNVFHSLVDACKNIKWELGGLTSISTIKNYQHHIDDVLFEFNFVGFCCFEIFHTHTQTST